MLMTNWKHIKLGNISEVIGGGTPSTKNYDFWNGNIPWLTPKDLSGYNNRYISRGERNITKLGLQNSSARMLPKGAVLLTSRAPIGYIAIAENDVCTNQGFKSIVLKDGYCSEFFYYLLKNNIDYIVGMGSGSTFAEISGTQVKNLEFTVPPIDVQKKIAGVLGALDDKIELNNKINANLEQQAQALFNEKILNNPKHGCIGDYCSIKSGFAFKSAWWQNAGVRVIKIKNIGPSGLNLQECSYVSDDKVSIAKDFVVKGGDLLIAMTGATIGKFAIVPHTDEILLVNQRVGKFFLGNNPLEKLPFIYCTLKQPEVASVIINRGQGSAQPNISGNDIMSITCTYSDENIISDFNNICRPYFEKIIINQYENTRLSALRDTLLPKLMSGEIDVSKVDILNSNLLFRENA